MSRFISLHDDDGDAVVISVANIIKVSVASDGTSSISLHGLAVPVYVTEEVVDIYNRLDTIRGD